MGELGVGTTNFNGLINGMSESQKSLHMDIVLVGNFDAHTSLSSMSRRINRTYLFITVSLWFFSIKSSSILVGFQLKMQ